MPKTTIPIPNFISGVSQQVPELRFPAQQEEQINGLPSLKNGFGKRYPTQYIAKLPAAISLFNQWHFINRGSLTNNNPWSTDWSDDWGDKDETTQYAIAFGDQVINAINLNGRVEPFVYVDGAQAYLETSDPKNDLDFVTVQDFTFVLNKQKEVAMKTTQDTFRPFEALVFVARAAASTQYNIYINDVQQATFPTAASGHDTIDIASDLEGDLLLNLDPAEFTVVRNGSTIYIASLTGTDFSIRAEGDADDALVVFKGTTDKFSALPKLAINGFRIKIDNDTDYDEDNFWVEYVSDSLSDVGVWKESRQDGLYNEIDETTMPHQLIHNNPDIWSDDWSDDWGIETFSLSPVKWKERLVGDEGSAPPPSFVGNKINDIFYMRNRLGFVAGDNTIQSEDREHLNFWPTTLQTLLDTDPIDIGTSHTKSSTFKHAVPSQEKLLLFSDDTQFIYGSGDNVLSPKTVFVNPSSEVSINEKVRPFVASSSIFFVVDKKHGTSVKEISTTNTDDVIVPEDITTHVPDYIPEDIEAISGSTVDNLIFFYAPSTPNTLYMYKFIKEQERKILSSWTKWTFEGSGLAIQGFGAIKDTLYIIQSYTDGSYLYKINLTPDYLNTGLGHPVMLDRLVNVKGTYNSATNKTTWTLPHADDDTLTVVLDQSFADPGSSIQTSKITRPSSTSIAASGDYSSGSVWIGKRYWQEIELTQPMLKSVDDNVPRVEKTATFTVHNLIVDFFKSSAFQIQITYKDGTVRTYPYSAILTDNTDFQVGQFNFNSDKFVVPIKVKGGRKVTVKIRSDNYVPSNFYAGRWIMNITRRKGRL